MTSRPHTLRPVGVDTPGPPSRPAGYSVHDLEALRAVMDRVPFTLLELIRVLDRYPKTIAVFVKECARG